MITLNVGSMFAGKTSTMLHQLKREKLKGKSVLLFRPDMDNRGMITHDLVEQHEITEQFCVANTLPNREQWKELKRLYDVIGIDEGQFYSNLFSFVRMAENDVDIFIASLNGSSEKEPFPQVSALIPHVEIINKLNAVCIDCGSDYGSFSHYIGSDKKELLKVGDSEYVSLCRECLLKRLTD